MTWAEQNCQK